jgi:hypothetical protein
VAHCALDPVAQWWELCSDCGSCPSTSQTQKKWSSPTADWSGVAPLLKAMVQALQGNKRHWASFKYYCTFD